MSWHWKERLKLVSCKVFKTVMFNPCLLVMTIFWLYGMEAICGILSYNSYNICCVTIAMHIILDIVHVKNRICAR